MADLFMSADHCGTPAQQLNERFTAAYAQHLPMVRATISGRLDASDKHLVDDLAQNTFLAFYRRLHNNADIRNTGGLLRVMARQSIGHHFRLMRNQYERPVDTGHWSFANSNLSPAASGALEPVRTSFHAAVWSDDDNKPVIPRIPGPRKPTAATGDVCPLCEYFRCRCKGAQSHHSGDSDPNPDEALRRVQGKPAPIRQGGGTR